MSTTASRVNRRKGATSPAEPPPARATAPRHGVDRQPREGARADAVVPGGKEDRHFVTALARGLEILGCFRTTLVELGTAEIAAMTGLPQPTVWRLCRTMVRTGHLVAVPKGQRLQLGSSVLALGHAVLDTFDLFGLVRPRMQALADRMKSSVSLAGRDGLNIVYLQRVSAESVVGMNLSAGSRMPLLKTSLGWAYLMALPAQARAALLAEIRQSDPAGWRAIERQVEPTMREFERKSYVLKKGLANPGIIAAAIPIVSPYNSQVLALNCSGHASSIDVGAIEHQVVPELREIAEVVRGGLFRQISATAGPTRMSARKPVTKLRHRPHEGAPDLT